MRIAITMDVDGTFEVVTDEPSEVYIICEYAPNDRVYRLSSAHTVGRDKVDALLGDSEIGHNGDDRHEAVKNRILSAECGERHLRPVD